MKNGKLTENVWKRSVLKQIKTKREEVITGAGIGADCAVFSLEGSGLSAVSVQPVVWNGVNAAKHAVYGAANAVAASGAEPVAVMFSALLPASTEESDIRIMTEQIEAVCGRLNLQAAGDGIRVTEAVNRPVFTMTGIGCLTGEEASVKRIRPGQDIVASKWIGLEGTAILAREREKELLTKYPFRFMEEAKEFDRFLSIVPEAATAVKSGVCAMHGVTEGGIFGALWELAEGAGVGLEIDLKRIPVKQETIEICEFFEINPYELLSGGCLLMAADNGYDLARILEGTGIPAAVIGKTTGSHDRVVINEEERRFLELPKPDEIYRVLG
jgi:Hydrogenase maturation factor